MLVSQEVHIFLRTRCHHWTIIISQHKTKTKNKPRTPPITKLQIKIIKKKKNTLIIRWPAEIVDVCNYLGLATPQALQFPARRNTHSQAYCEAIRCTIHHVTTHQLH